MNKKSKLVFLKKALNMLKTKMEQEDFFYINCRPHGLRGQHYQYLLNERTQQLDKCSHNGQKEGPNPIDRDN